MWETAPMMNDDESIWKLGFTVAVLVAVGGIIGLAIAAALTPSPVLIHKLLGGLVVLFVAPVVCTLTAKLIMKRTTGPAERRREEQERIDELSALGREYQASLALVEILQKQPIGYARGKRLGTECAEMVSRGGLSPILDPTLLSSVESALSLSKEVNRLLADLSDIYSTNQGPGWTKNLQRAERRIRETARELGVMLPAIMEKLHAYLTRQS